MSGPSESTSKKDAAAFLKEISATCPLQEFSPGERLRVKGHHYSNMYLVTRGECLVELDPGRTGHEPRMCGPGESIGEIGFLRGLPATANVTARDNMQVREIDNKVLARLETEKPGLVARLLQTLGEIADDRMSYDLTFSGEMELDDADGNVEILLCRNEEMLREAQKLRYEVYCTELKRKSPFADHKKGIIADALDDFGHCFIAVRGGKTVGTLRSNSPVEGSIGSMEQLYGMPQSEHHPEATSVTTKFIVVREMRRSPVAMQLISHASQYGMNYGVIESYIDCVPKLLPYYRAMGFSVSEKSFLHPENGPSIPMRINLVKNAGKLVGEVGLRRMISFYARSKVYKLAERLRR